ncbi:hypothetical protein DL95DRAFT_404846 [Leptodontidium sp. 2 PMI_412]|nr:hypothetical protein DL95DRAFT_404846 [Leptodontidium sp. 2 PMI_412]
MNSLPFTNWEFKDLVKVCDTLKYGGQMDIPEMLLPMAQSDLTAIAALVAIAHPLTFRNLTQAESFMEDVVSQCLDGENNRDQLIAVQPPESNSHISKNVRGLNTFHKFPEMPVELRLMVWEASLPKSRVVELFWRHGNGQDTMSKVEHWKLLNLRRACRESKGVVEKKYQTLKKDALMALHLSLSSVVLIDFATDIIYNPNYIFNDFRVGATALQRSTIRTVALHTLWRYDFCGTSLGDGTIWVDNFPQLRKLIWVFPEEDGRDKGTEMIFIEAKELLERENVKQAISDQWKAFMASRDNPEALGRIKMVYKEIKRPNPRDLLARDFEALVAKRHVR